MWVGGFGGGGAERGEPNTRQETGFIEQHSKESY